jgi:hypothetical protein
MIVGKEKSQDSKSVRFYAKSQMHLSNFIGLCYQFRSERKISLSYKQSKLMNLFYEGLQDAAVDDVEEVSGRGGGGIATAGGCRSEASALAPGGAYCGL